VSKISTAINYFVKIWIKMRPRNAQKAPEPLIERAIKELML
jgi:hypothetical protein